MSWQTYVETLMAEGNCQDAAIVGLGDAKYVWASLSGGTFANITAAEIDAMVAKERDAFFTQGLTLGNKKCSVLRDSLNVDGDWTMDFRTKNSDGGPTYNISVARTDKVLVLLMGKASIHGGVLNKQAYGMADYLRRSGY
nr:profilin-2-like [Syngnathus scovelli]